MSPKRVYALSLKNNFGYEGMEIPEEARLLLDEFYEVGDLSPDDWKEIYTALLKKLTELHDPWQVLAVIYRAIELRSDFITANRIIGKLAKHFYLLFERLPGHRPYYVPSEVGRKVFEALISPFERAEVQAEAEVQIAAARQLSLTSFMTTSRRGVRT